MNVNRVLNETTALSEEDCFLVIQRSKPGFFFPLHTHSEFELNYLENADGALRIVGDSVEEISGLDLVMVAGGIRHTYTNHNCLRRNIWEITIQFRTNQFESLIDKRHFQSIKNMFLNAQTGIVFSREAILRIQNDLKELANDQVDSFGNFLKLLKILKKLSLDQNTRRLSNSESNATYNKQDTGRLESIMVYLHENYQSPILLSEAALYMSMSESSLTRFLKKWTGKTFIDNLNDIRIAAASNRLIDTSDSISEICYKCGFNNMSNFNRLFKKRKGHTPTVYRELYALSRFRI